MTLDEAIEHAGQVSLDKADESLNCDNECAREHWQLAEWLHELKTLREAYGERQKEHLQLIIECSDAYDEIDNLKAENAKLRELVTLMYRDMQGVLGMSTDTVWVDDIGTLRDEMDYHMQAMAELGMPPADYERRMHELGVEVDDG